MTANREADMSDRMILHADINAFYASVECLLRPELKAVPIAVVAGLEENRHGVILAKNEAAKKHGVKIISENDFYNMLQS